MDLWIRSQDDGLYKIVGFKPPLCCDDTKPDEKYAIIGICYEYRMIELGIYKTKERALEILNEIQNILMPKMIYKTFDVEAKDLEFRQNALVKVGKEVGDFVLSQSNTFVYEMPKE